MVACPEDPEKLCGQPIGQYHCPDCGCMQVACIPHMCDPELCLLPRCDCLPEGQLLSWNMQETLLIERDEIYAKVKRTREALEAINELLCDGFTDESVARLGELLDAW